MSEHSWDDGWNETTNIGRCTVDGLCDASSQALFEADLLTPSQYVSNSGKPLPVIPKSWESIWTFGNSTGDYFKENYWSYGHHPPLFRSRDYVLSLYELGSVYRVECVPIDAECYFDFTVKEQQLVFEKYEVKRNGMALSREVVEETDHWDYTTVKEVTAFGENCNSKKLSGGAIAGIVIGSLAAVGIAVYVFLWYKKKKEGEAIAEDTGSNPLTASLLAEAGGTERMTDNSGDGATP